ncbi:MAG: hypothetical protein AAGB93_02125 [Planctomycetota bacterium]
MTRPALANATRVLAHGLLPLATVLPAGGAQDVPGDPGLHAPVRVAADGAPIAVEEPGFAFPAWHDVTGDGRADLVVGQFNGGKIRFYPRAKGDSFGAGRWLEAEGEVAEVPGVW